MKKRVGLSQLNSALYEAFSLAQDTRAAKGLTSIPADEPPKCYKMTMFWSPADYVDLLREMRRQRWPKGLVSFIQHCVWLSVPRLAKRPRIEAREHAKHTRGRHSRSVAA